MSDPVAVLAREHDLPDSELKALLERDRKSVV